MAIAAGLALAILIVSRRWFSLSVALVFAAAGGRLGQGVHYPHDLLAGLGVGIGWVVAIILLSAPTTAVLLRRFEGRQESHHASSRPTDGDEDAP
jgi:membrane-associated phospholipid phosphatase